MPPADIIYAFSDGNRVREILDQGHPAFWLAEVIPSPILDQPNFHKAVTHLSPYHYE